MPVKCRSVNRRGRNQVQIRGLMGAAHDMPCGRQGRRGIHQLSIARWQRTALASRFVHDAQMIVLDDGRIAEHSTGAESISNAGVCADLLGKRPCYHRRRASPRWESGLLRPGMLALEPCLLDGRTRQLSVSAFPGTGSTCCGNRPRHSAWWSCCVPSLALAECGQVECLGGSACMQGQVPCMASEGQHAVTVAVIT